MVLGVSALERLSAEAFAEFYEKTAPRLRAYIRRVCGDAAAADDILQEAYIRLLNAAPAAEPQRKAYLYRTATRLIIDEARAARRERHGLAALAWWRSGEMVQIGGGGGDLEKMFRLLNVRERALLWLAYVEGASHAEIAAALGCGEKSVRVLLFRARRKVEQILRDNNFSSGDLR